MTAIEPREVTGPESETVTSAERDDTVRCRACGGDLTSRRLAIEVGGGHDHTFRNPAGYSFHLVCFSDAPGCRAEGAPTSDATWFAGFEWNFAVCAGCGSHLGWWFLSGHRSFVGLIATRLA